MNWSQVRESYPDQWVKLQILNSHKENDFLYIDDMDIIQPFLTDKDATRELVKNSGNSLVFHTSHEVIRVKIIKNMGLFRRIPS